MVGPQNIPDGTNIPGNAPVATGVSTTNRGFISAVEEAPYVAEPGMRVGQTAMSWGSVIGGSILTLSLVILSGALGTAIGLTVNADRDGLGWGTALWTILTSAIAFFAGGYISAYLAGNRLNRLGLVNGLMVWALCLPLIALFFSGLFGSVFSAMVNNNVLPRGNVAPAPSPDGVSLMAAGWVSFITLIVGAICAGLGGSSAAAGKDYLNRLPGGRYESETRSGMTR